MGAIVVAVSLRRRRIEIPGCDRKPLIVNKGHEAVLIAGVKKAERGCKRSRPSFILGIFYYSYLSYKAESAGTELVKVDPRDTREMCSNCGSIVKKTLSERVHECPYCGFVADRDYNAAVNIHRVGM